MTDTLRTSAAALLAEILGLPVDPSIGLRRADCDGWDSLKHLEVVMGFEDEFSVRLTAEEMTSTDSLDDLVRLVEKHQ